MTLSRIPYSTTVRHDGREYVVNIPSLLVPKCSDLACGEFVFDDEANKQIDAAFRRQAQLLAPDEIRAGREKLGMDQQEFAARIGVAASTLSRWETGAQIQQRSLNRVMRALFLSPEVQRVFAALESIEALPPTAAAFQEALSLPATNTASRLFAVTAVNATSGRCTVLEPSQAERLRLMSRLPIARW